MRVKSYKFGKPEAYRLEVQSRRLFKEDEVVPLTPKRFEILLMLIEKAGQVVRKEEIMSRIWAGQEVEESNLTQHIFFLRRTLGDDPRTPSYIMTIPGAGYLFYQSVIAVSEDGTEETIGGFQAALPSDNQDAAAGIASSPEIAPPADSSAPSAAPAGRVAGGARLLAGGLLLVAGVALILYLTGGFRSGSQVNGPSPDVHPLVTMPGMKGDLAFSRDGATIAFTSEGDTLDSQNIYIKKIADSEPTRLTNHKYTDHSLTWSPDNSRIAFLRSGNLVDQRNQLFVITVNEGKEIELARVWHGLDWSPDGKFIAICDNEGNGSPTAIYLLAVEGGNRRPVSRPPTGANLFDSDPKFSPDGREVVFTRWTSNNTGELHVANLASGKVRQLTTDRSRIGTVQWSPDGGEILFVSNRTGNYRVWKIRPEGGNPAPVEGFLGEVNRMAISPVDRSIAYTQRFNDTNILIDNIPGRGAGSPGLPCHINSTRAEDSPQFSPDGSRVAFMSARSGFEEIWIANADCTQPVQLTSFNERGLGSPRWSPDGRRIAFDRHVEEQSEIFTIEIESRQLQRLTEHPAPDFLPSWSHDGREIFFCSERAPVTQIWKVPATGGQANMVTRYGGRESWAAPDGRTLYLTRFDQLWRFDLLTGEEARVEGLNDIRLGRYWTLFGSSIYYLTREVGNRSRVHRLDLANGKNSQVMELQSSPANYVPGLSIAPREERIAISLITYQSSDISLLKGWR